MKIGRKYPSTAAKCRKNLSKAEMVFDLGRGERKQFCSVGTGCPVATKIRQLSLANL